MVAMLVTTVLERERGVDPWGLLARQPSLIVELQANERLPKRGAWGWGGAGSLIKLFATQAERPEFRSPGHTHAE